MGPGLRGRVEELLRFWFGAPGSPEYGRPRAQWYRRDPEFDESCRAGFEGDLETAERGKWESARGDPRGALALTLLFDQIPRNIFRGSPRAFATDGRALAVAHQAIDDGHDVALPLVLRRFFYLPFEHSERLEDQQRSVVLNRAATGGPGGQEAVDYALRHLTIIERFGRFPHRNEVLGRTSTAEEQSYLENGGERF